MSGRFIAPVTVPSQVYSQERSMKLAVSPTAPAAPALARRLADYVELTKPRIAVMVLITVAAGYLMAAGTNAHLVPLLHTLLGTALVAGAASAWNMWIERETDAQMRRTADRPLPAGRLHHLEVVVFATALVVTGINYLYHALPSPAAAIVAALTFVSYVLVYTPLKTVTVFNTHIGAVPGALPPVIGWCAATGTIGWDAVALFLILLFWQLPHFMAIAWMYRHDYAQAGHRMIPCSDPSGRKTSRAMITWCVVLVAASLMPLGHGRMDWLYLIGALALGTFFLASTLRFRADRTEQQARRVLRASILYLPAMMGLLLVHSVGCAPTESPSTGHVRASDISIPVPDFTMSERSGKRTSRDDLKGKVWVASFVFTRCTGPCPQVTATMARLQKDLDLKNRSDLRLVTFTIDPEKDTPNELKDYANSRQADPDKWLFLTGMPEADLHKLLHDGFKVTAQRAEKPGPGNEFDHSSRLAVVDRQGNIRGYFDGLPSGSGPDARADFEENMTALEARVQELLSE
jgi:heme o synthase